MGRKNIVASELKLRAVREYENGEGSLKRIAQKYNVSKGSFEKWLMKYRSIGESAFIETHCNNTYTAEFKFQVVKAYSHGEGSLSDIAIKFKIPSPDTVSKWIMKYNSHEKLKTSGIKGGKVMTKGRKSTFKERIEIVKYSIEHQYNYAKTATKYEVSYQQVYTWTKKYEKKGIDGLQDMRGKRKKLDEMTKLERLKAQNKLLKAQNTRQQMEIDFLKKLEVIERRRS